MWKASELSSMFNFFKITRKGLFTPSNYVTVTVTLVGGTFDLFGKINGAARQRYGDRDVVAWCE